MAKLNKIEPGSIAALKKQAKSVAKAPNANFASPIEEFFLTNPITRASAVMGECAQMAAGMLKAAE